MKKILVSQWHNVVIWSQAVNINQNFLIKKNTHETCWLQYRFCTKNFLLVYSLVWTEFKTKQKHSWRNQSAHSIIFSFFIQLKTIKLEKKKTKDNQSSLKLEQFYFRIEVEIALNINFNFIASTYIKWKMIFNKLCSHFVLLCVFFLFLFFCKKTRNEIFWLRLLENILSIII